MVDRTVAKLEFADYGVFLEQHTHGAPVFPRSVEGCQSCASPPLHLRANGRILYVFKW